MEPQHTQRNEGPRRHLWLLAATALLLALVAIACHRSAERHQAAIHSIGDEEQYCVDTTQSSIDNSAARVFLAHTLYGPLGNLEENWDQIDGTKSIYWVPKEEYTNDCVEMPFQTWVEYRYEDTPVGGYSNTYHEGQECPDDHCHYKKSKIILKTNNVDGYDSLARHTINHETGHALGLLDPLIPDTSDYCVNCGIVSDADDRCTWDCADGYITCLFEDPILNLNWWIPSIMHSAHYCGEEVNSFGQMTAYNLTWPNQYDRDKVIEIIEELP